MSSSSRPWATIRVRAASSSRYPSTSSSQCRSRTNHAARPPPATELAHQLPQVRREGGVRDGGRGVLPVEDADRAAGVQQPADGRGPAVEPGAVGEHADGGLGPVHGLGHVPDALGPGPVGAVLQRRHGEEDVHRPRPLEGRELLEPPGPVDGAQVVEDGQQVRLRGDGARVAPRVGVRRAPGEDVTGQLRHADAAADGAEAEVPGERRRGHGVLQDHTPQIRPERAEDRAEVRRGAQEHELAELCQPHADRPGECSAAVQVPAPVQGLGGDRGDLDVRAEDGPQVRQVQLEPRRVRPLRVHHAHPGGRRVERGLRVLQQMGGPQVEHVRSLGRGLVHLPVVLEQDPVGGRGHGGEVQHLVRPGGGEVEIAAAQHGQERRGDVVGGEGRRRQSVGHHPVDAARGDVRAEVPGGHAGALEPVAAHPEGHGDAVLEPLAVHVVGVDPVALLLEAGDGLRL